MNQEVERDLESLSGVLSDIETMDLPWTEFGKVSIGIDWETLIYRLKKLRSESLTPKQQAQYNQIVERIRAQKSKILELDYTYPEFTSYMRTMRIGLALDSYGNKLYYRYESYPTDDIAPSMVGRKLPQV